MDARDQQLRSQTDGIWEIARNVRGSIINKGLLLAAALVVIDTLIVSHYQPASALALLRDTPPLTLLTGVLLNLGPTLLAVAMWGSLIAGIASVLASDGAGAVNRLGASLGLWVLSLFVVDERSGLHEMLFAGAWICATVAALWIRERISRSTGEQFFVLTPIGLLLTAIASLNSAHAHEALMRPFLPAEEITIGGASAASTAVQTEVGYVLEVDREWMTFMREDDRAIQYVRLDDVRSRQTCLVGTDGPIKPKAGIDAKTATTSRCDSTDSH